MRKFIVILAVLKLAIDLLLSIPFVKRALVRKTVDIAYPLLERLIYGDKEEVKPKRDNSEDLISSLIRPSRDFKFGKVKFDRPKQN